MNAVYRYAFCIGLISWLAFGGLYCAATAGPFSNLVVFGDSLSDIGNVDSSPLVDIPGPYYWNGRFSNGPVYAETLMTGLGLPALRRSTSSSGTDFAYGGAKTTGTGFPDFFVVKDIDDQVSAYLSSSTPNASTLYVVFAGANDLLDDSMNINGPIGSLSGSITQLYNAGARKFLVFNLPPLEATPRLGNMPLSPTQPSQKYNAALTSMLNTFQSGHAAATIYRFDITALFTQALANSPAYGLVNVHDSAAPGLQPGASSYNTNQIVPNPNQYLFWDDLHPTAAVHLIFGHRALDLFFPPGDYNRNVASDAGDYVAFRKGLGTTYVPIDYSIWRAHFGQTTSGGSGSEATGYASAVPEPAGIVICFILFMLPLARMRRSS